MDESIPDDIDVQYDDEDLIDQEESSELSVDNTTTNDNTTLTSKTDEINNHFNNLFDYSSNLLNQKQKYIHSHEDLTGFTGLYSDFSSKPSSSEAELFNCLNCHAIDSIKNVIGVNVCTNCGIEKGPEITEEMECQYSGLALGDNSATPRSGLSNNKLLFQSNFSTKIVGNHTSYSLKQINNVWNTLDYTERTLLKTFKKITDNCRQKGIPNNAVSYTQVLYKQVYDEQKKAKKGNKGSRADKLEGLIAGCIYYSCKAYGINRSHQEIAEICGIDKKEVSFGCKLFFKLMHDKINLNDNNTSYNDFLERYSSQLDLDDRELNIIKDVCFNIVQLEILDNSKPSTMAAISIFFCSNLYNFDLDKKDIAEKCHTTEPTLNKNFKILMDYVEKLIV